MSSTKKKSFIRLRPKDGEREKHVGDGLEGLDVFDEGLAVLALGVVQHRLLLLRLPTLGPFLKSILDKTNSFKLIGMLSKNKFVPLQILIMGVTMDRL